MSSPPAAHPPSPFIAHPPGGLLHAIQSLLYLIVIAIFIVAFTAQPFQIPSGSMEPALLIGDFLLVDKQLVSAANHDPLPHTAIRRGDIIVFYYPIDPTLHLVKRVIGLPGDHIRLHEGRVYLSGHLLDEPYAFYGPAPPNSFRDNFPRMSSAEPGIDARWWIEMRHLIDHGELIVPTGHYFVLGDNRNDSDDSRYWGFVPQAAIVGKPFLIYFSLRRTERDDPEATAQLRSPLSPGRREPHLFDQIGGFARWSRTLRIVH